MSLRPSLSRPATAALALAAGLLATAPALAGRPRPNGFGLDVRPLNTSCVAPALSPDVAVALVPALGGAAFSFATTAVQSPVDANAWYVTERAGRLQRVLASNGSQTTALDLSSRVTTAGEGGLLGLALHPGFAQNGHVFVYYVVPESPLRSVISRFTTSNGGASFDPLSERIILALSHSNNVHIGGDLHFGRDGKLYLAFGDGGSSSTAQDPQNLHGKMLRLDVDAANPYAIPPDNPFVGGGALPEVYALGFRNPYRWSVDALTGELWLGDVGSSGWEEVDSVVAGGNYGWPRLEGFQCNSGPCDDPDYLDPELVYSHTEGCAVIGGFVYRGAALPDLSGAYLFGDYCSRSIWSALPDGAGGYAVTPLATSGSTFTSFAQARDGEVLVLQTTSAKRLAPAAGSPPDPMPERLADTGCVDPTDPRKPAPGLVPYAIREPFWSDGAAKERWVALPSSARLSLAADGDLDLPPGAVTMKTFELDGKLIETRLFVRYGDGSYGGYSYEWNDAETEALLLPGAKQRTVGTQTWSYPSRAQCLQCHTSAAGSALGLELAQLGREAFYPATSRTAAQLETLAHIGFLDAPLPAPAARPRLERDTTDHAARAWLHVNCAGCHRPGGPTGAAMDLRASTPLASMGLCDATPSFGDLGVAGAKLLAPGDPARSLISLRARLVGPGQMPPLARARVDTNGTATLDAWIRSFASCAGPDGDGDGRVDDADNCPAASNAGQADFDGDGIGDACETLCHDGVDSDGDGKRDYPLDPGCAAAASLSENPRCDNGVDDDGDGRVDAPADIGCGGAAATRENPACADGVDNDGDGRIDFDGGRWLTGTALSEPDADCDGRPSAPSEAPDSGCGLGFELVPALAVFSALRRGRMRRRG